MVNAGIERDALLDLLNEVNLLAPLSGGELRTLAGYLAWRDAQPDEVIFSEGDPGDSLFLLAAGSVRIQKECDQRHARTIAVEDRSRAIGEMSLLDGEPRSATCVALEASTLLVLTQEKLAALAKSHPGLAYRVVTEIARLLSKRLRLTSGRLVESLS
jgi:CRP/FNR family cyclic AMP-dependent transcriptional regulator